jgi:YgiT-type zinc finger domain-containing protein
MKCIGGCVIEHDETGTNRPSRQRGKLVVIQGTTAEVCPECGDLVFTPKSARRAQKADRLTGRARRSARMRKEADDEQS